jgi:Flp pilus assembly protein TadG
MAAGRSISLAHAIRHVRRLAADARGVAAMEFALIIGTIAFVALNGIDLAAYYYARMQVENAGQMGAQAAWKACDSAHLPATLKCSGFNAAASSGVQSSQLGANVQFQAGSPSEAFYCLKADGSLLLVSSDANAVPANCSAAGNVSAKPANYVQVAVQYSFKPVTGVGVGKWLPTTITSTALMRMN